MIIGKVEVKLYKRLEDFFSNYGYDLLPDRKQFRRKTKEGFQNIIFSVSETRNEYWLEVNFGLRNQNIEQIAQQFLNNAPEYQSEANTLVISIGKFNDLKYFRFKIENKDDLEETTEQIVEFFKNQGFQFLDMKAQAKNLEKTLNNEPHKSCKYIYNQSHRVVKGLIAAKLFNSSRYENLIDIYRNYLFRMGTDEELINYERLVSFLDYYSPN